MLNFVIRRIRHLTVRGQPATFNVWPLGDRCDSSVPVPKRTSFWNRNCRKPVNATLSSGGVAGIDRSERSLRRSEEKQALQTTWIGSAAAPLPRRFSGFSLGDFRLNIPRNGKRKNVSEMAQAAQAAAKKSSKTTTLTERQAHHRLARYFLK